MKLVSTAAVRPPRSLPKNVQFRRPTATARRFLQLWRQRSKSAGKLTLADVDAFVGDLAGQHSNTTVADRCSSLRSFLRFLRMTGRIRRDLAACVMAPRTHVAARPPRAMAWSHVKRILNTLNRDGVAYLLHKYVKRACIGLPALRNRRVTPHVMRHGCAVALLQAGIDVTVIRDYLGHASVATTSRYITTNLKMKRDVLEAFWKRAGLT